MDFVRAVADMGSAGVCIAWAVIGVVAVLMVFVGVTLAAALMAKTAEQQRYRLRLLRTVLKFVVDLARGWGKR